MFVSCLLDSVLRPFFFFNDTATTEIYTLSLHDALPICFLHLHDPGEGHRRRHPVEAREADVVVLVLDDRRAVQLGHQGRSEEHTSELQSRLHLVCRLLLEKKKTTPA